MKTNYFIFFFLCFSLLSNSQNKQELINNKLDSLLMVSRTKADKVMAHFDSLHTSKLLYSLDDEFYYLIFRKKSSYEEYYIVTDSSGNVCEIHHIVIDKPTKKQLSQINPFDLSQYHKDYVVKIDDSKFVRGGPSYFVVKDTNGNRYGEYRLASLTLPSPINGKLLGYLQRNLSKHIPYNPNINPR